MKRRVFNILSAVSLVLALVGCSGRPAASESPCHGNRIFYRGTNAYYRQVRTFKITLKQADGIARDFGRKELGLGPDDAIYYGVPLIVVGCDYVFSFPPIKGRIALNGYYVNGFSGDVRRVRSDKLLPRSRLGPAFRGFHNNMPEPDEADFAKPTD